MNFTGAQKYILEHLRSELASDLHYHGLHHTLDVCQSVEKLAAHENISGDDLTLLRTAACYHDAGFLEQYSRNESIAVRIAQESLPRFGYTADQIDIIDGIVMATRFPQSPRTHLEQVMCDADLDYLGRTDFHTIAHLLYCELVQYGLVGTEKEWNKMQARFLEHHTYFTPTAQASRETMKQKHLNEIRQMLAV